MLDKQYNEVKTFYDILLYPTIKGWRCVIDVALDVSFDTSNILCYHLYTQIHTNTHTHTDLTVSS